MSIYEGRNFNIDYCRQRLSNTVVRLTETLEYVTVLEIFDQSCVEILTIKKTKPFKTEVKQVPLSKLEDKSPHSLGFSFIKETNFGFLIQRIPLRNDWRQGLRPNNVRIFYPFFRNDACVDISLRSGINRIEMVEFFRFMYSYNEDPVSLNKALDLVENGVLMCPFHPDWCVDSNFNLWSQYQIKRPVGKVIDETRIEFNKGSLFEEKLWYDLEEQSSCRLVKP